MAMHVESPPSVEEELKLLKKRNTISAVSVSAGSCLLLALLLWMVKILVEAPQQAEFEGYVPPPDPPSELQRPSMNPAPRPSGGNPDVMTNVIVSVDTGPMVMPDIEIPPIEDTGMGMSETAGTGLGDGEGDGVGSGIGMGGTGGGGSSFCGSFYDLKQTKSAAPSPYKEHTQANCEGVLKEISHFYNSGWPKGYFDKYFKSPTNLYVACFYMLHSLDKEAPYAYKVQDKVEQSRWLAVYSGRVKAPKSGKFRFVGIGDSVLAVRFNGKNVLACGFHTLEDNVWNGNNRPTYRQGKDFYAYEGCDAWNNLFGGFQAGTPFTVEKDQWYEMDVLVSEIGGGAFGFCLLIDDMDDANKARDRRGTPIFQLFRTSQVEPTSEEAYAQIKFPDDNMRVDPPYDKDSLVWVAKPSRGSSILNKRQPKDK